MTPLLHPRARLTAAALAACLLLAPATAGAAGAGDRDGDRAGGRAGRHESPRAQLLRHDVDARSTVASYGADAPATTFTGYDGATYDVSPWAVPASDGTVFLGADFDLACAYEPLYEPALKRLDRLANLIRQSGRTVQYLVAPNKSSVDTAALASVALPHGACDATAVSAGIRLLDRWDRPSYIPMRRQLHQVAKKTEPTYWQLDTHWNTVGGSLFAEQLAQRLDPRLARRQHYAPGEQTIAVDLFGLGYVPQQYETGPSLTPDTGVSVTPRDASPTWDPATVTFDLSWSSHPARKTWGGKTLLAGDSFFFRALGSLMPMFRKGHFLWVDPNTSTELATSIAQSRTVVLEVVQRFLPVSLLTSTAFYKQVRAALRQADGAR